MTERERTIKYIVPNLRHRWPKDLATFSDNELAETYENFSLSDEFGDNDAKFPRWFNPPLKG